MVKVYNLLGLKQVFLLLISFICVAILYNLRSSNIDNSRIKIQVNSNADVKVFDLNQPLSPASDYENIKCQDSVKIFVTTKLCLHDLSKDIWVSGSIAKAGVWEGNIVTKFLSYIKENPEWLVLDVGAQIGQYSLFAAKLDRKVVSVEPFYDNVLRIHKASTLANLQDKITLIKNAVSDKRNDIRRLTQEKNNIGGQSLIKTMNKTFKKDSNDKYLVETIYFDDIVDYLPKKSNGENFKEAIIKMDIEGFEPYALSHASKLFETIKVNVILMEWMTLSKIPSIVDKVEEMIKFLTKQKMNPYDHGSGKKLDIRAWKNWPGDIIWKRDGY